MAIYYENPNLSLSPAALIFYFILFSNVIEENEYQAILRVRDSVQLVENALLEREQVGWFHVSRSCI